MARSSPFRSIGPGANTWHGFEPRPIVGVRRLMEINYVRSNWRDRDQLAFSERPIRTDPAVV
jgi:hypothetical protein